MYKGAIVADYAITGKLDSADVSPGEYLPKITNDGEVVRAARCRYSGAVNGTIRVYKIPELYVQKSLRLDGSDDFTRPATSSGCPTLTDTATILRKSGVDAVVKVRTELMNLFSPEGYVVEHRQPEEKPLMGGKDSFVKLTIGKNGGVKQGDEVEFYSRRSTEDPLRGTKSVGTM